MFVLKKITLPSVCLIGLGIITPFLADWHFPLLDGAVVKVLENLQLLMLLFAAIFSYFYIRPLQYHAGKRLFWLWAVFWWVLLLGRSISWGRDYFPEVSHDYFRVISIFFIAPVVLMLCSKSLHQEIKHKFKTMQFPIYSFMLAVVALIISDSVEHSRLIGPFFLHDRAYKDFIEEMYEFPVIWGLFETTYLLMKQEKYTQQ